MNAESLIIKILMEAGIIPARYTGRIVLNIGCGGMSGIERWDKNGRNLNLQGMNQIIFSKLLQDFGQFADNAT